MNLSLSFARTINASLDSLFATSPRRAAKTSRLLKSQARRWWRLSAAEQVDQVCRGWGVRADSAKYDKIIGQLMDWAVAINPASVTAGR